MQMRGAGDFCTCIPAVNSVYEVVALMSTCSAKHKSKNVCFQTLLDGGKTNHCYLSEIISWGG